MEINFVKDNGIRIILKGRHIDWFANTGCLHPNYSDRDYTTPMKEDLAIGHVDFWAGGGVSIRSVGPTLYAAVWSDMYKE